MFSFCKEAQVKNVQVYILWQNNSAEPVRNAQDQITAWGRGVWGLNKDGRPKELPKYISN